MAKRYRHSMRTRRLMSHKARGKNNPFFGRRHSRATKAALARRFKGKRNPMFGRRHSVKARQKISLARRRAIRAGKKRRR